MIERKYVKCDGSHINNADAGKIGQAVELLFEKLGHAPSVSQFAEAVKSKRNPAHFVVKKKYDELKANAWRQASRYCLESIDIIIINNGKEGPPLKQNFLLDLEDYDDSGKERIPQAERYTVVTRDMLRRNPGALNVYEQQFRSTIRTLIQDFRDVAGANRTLRVVTDEVNSLCTPLAAAAD